jgi:hypothetical protein
MVLHFFASSMSRKVLLKFLLASLKTLTRVLSGYFTGKKAASEFASSGTILKKAQPSSEYKRAKNEA